MVYPSTDRKALVTLTNDHTNDAMHLEVCFDGKGSEVYLVIFTDHEGHRSTDYIHDVSFDKESAAKTLMAGVRGWKSYTMIEHVEDTLPQEG